MVEIRKGQAPAAMERAPFSPRFRASFIDPAFRGEDAALQRLEQSGIQVDVLDLSLLTSEYALHIHPCKGCVSTAMPLCHWPCSCYPKHALNQTNDWMGLVDAGAQARLGRYIGYYAPYATSHQALDQDSAVQEETRNVARAVAHTVVELRVGRLQAVQPVAVRTRPK